MSIDLALSGEAGVSLMGYIELVMLESPFRQLSPTASSIQRLRDLRPDGAETQLREYP